MIAPAPYTPQNKVRIVTAASLFDGHDAAINIMRRIMQASGAEVIHLGHNRSAQDIVDTAIQEDAQAIAITSYQGGHLEFFKYLYDLLQAAHCGHIKLFGGGGGTILPHEIEELHAYGIARIYSPDDGRQMGLQGMINDLLQQADFPTGNLHVGKWKAAIAEAYGDAPPQAGGAMPVLAQVRQKISPRAIARLISAVENEPELVAPIMEEVHERLRGLPQPPVLGITGTGGAGKSSLVDELVRRFLLDFPDKHLAVVSVDPSKRKTGGALLGDRIRMNAVFHPRVYMRSLATRQSNLALSRHIPEVLAILRAAQFDLIILETSGIGQSDTEIADHSEVSLYVMTPEYGAASQLEKVDMLDYADLIAINKSDKRGAQDALRDVRKQYKRNRQAWEVPDDSLPVFGTIASQFNDSGMNRLYRAVMQTLAARGHAALSTDWMAGDEPSEKVYIIPPGRTRYLSEVAEAVRAYNRWTAAQAEAARQLYRLQGALEVLGESGAPPLEKGGPGGDVIDSFTGRSSKGIFTHPRLTSFRRELRNHPSLAEAALWRLLQNRQLEGRKFRRQHSVGPYVLDFYCPEEKLAVEIADSPTAQDAADELELFVRTYDIRVLRFDAAYVLGAPEEVLEEIQHAFGKQSSAPPSPPVSGGEPAALALRTAIRSIRQQLSPRNLDQLEAWPGLLARYAADEYRYEVRGREVRVQTYTRSLSGTRIPKVALPRYTDWGDILRWALQENVPGEFPFTAGVFPFKREQEDPTRMFAGEGGPERTNRRFHYVSLGMPARRLSTAFDSVTLYGEDPGHRPDIYGKIGNSGVSVCSLDDAKKLYSGFDLCDPATSVSMTINGPAATLLAFFFNAAIDQQCERYIREQGLAETVEARIQALYASHPETRPRYQGSLPEGNNGLGLMLLGVTGDQVLDPETYHAIKARTLRQVRGTVQADILKEDQAQNTCIFSTEFSLRLMGDVQQYFIDHRIQNFYSVSISGYHIAEAGANPITQLAFTLANGFTFLEYYLSRGMPVDEVAPNFSFFFSNGVDPEYAVIGRVARRIWAKALRDKYHAGERAQKLKYHIQTSGRSLHAQEIAFNDIRTTLQALYAIYDNCNSLHTNAYDEAITTPTEESVRRAMAIQLIINHELGLANNQNPLQGAFIIEELTDLVEEAVLMEFDRITERGGVLGAMETMYQRGKIQDESLHYETLKHTGELPIIGVNTFLSKEGSPTILPQEVIRSTPEEKAAQIQACQAQQERLRAPARAGLRQLQEAAIRNENLFEQLMEVSKTATLGQITQALYEVGGQYRRNM
ncbi:MAG: methylmalonyl-CoA mutase family protein [Bacteroidia bacterium]|nr:methylmalonyl-CoA mutase family protein [Bacteroidia bacterium]